MRTTISIPEQIYTEARTLAGERSFSEFASEAIQARILLLKRERLARELEEGYRAEAESASLAPGWPSFEVEGLCSSSAAMSCRSAWSRWSARKSDRLGLAWPVRMAFP